MIIKENNKKSENVHNFAKLREMLKDLFLPSNYLLEDWESEYGYFYFKILREYEYLGGLLTSWIKIAEISLNYNDSDLNINFEDESEYLDLYNYLEKSKLKFNVDIKEE